MLLTLDNNVQVDSLLIAKDLIDLVEELTKQIEIMRGLSMVTSDPDRKNSLQAQMNERQEALTALKEILTALLDTTLQYDISNLTWTIDEIKKLNFNSLKYVPSVKS